MTRKEIAVDRRRALKALSVAGLAGLAGCTSDDDGGSENTDGDESGNTGGGENQTLTIAAVENATTQVFSQGMARVLDQHSDTVDLEIELTSGSEENFRLAGRGDVDLGAGAWTLGVPAARGTNPVEGIDFTGDKSLDEIIQQAYPVYQVSFWWATLDDSIETVEDMRGKKVGVGPSGSQYAYYAILKTAGVLDDVEPVNYAYDDNTFALREGRVDVAIGGSVAGELFPGWTQEMLGWDDVFVIPYTDDQLDNFADSSLMTSRTLPINEYYNRDLREDQYEAPTFTYGAWANENVGEDAMYEMSDALLGNYEEMHEFHEGFSEMSPEYVAENLATGVDVHPGVARYLQENDLWRDELQEG